MNAVLDVRYRIARGAAAAASFDGGWDALAVANPSATVFQTAAWYRGWTGAVAAAEHAEPLVITVNGDGRLRAGLALQIDTSAGGPGVIRALSSPWADYHDAVGAPGDAEAIARLATALDELVRAGHDVVLDDVVERGVLHAMCARLGADPEPSSPVAAIDLTDGAHVAQVTARAEHAVKWRRLNRLGTVRCVHHTAPAVLSERLPTFIAMHRLQWAGRSDAVAPFDGGVVDAAFGAMVRTLAPHNAVMLTELSLDDRPVAMYFGFVSKSRYLAYRTAFDAAYRRLSPGHLMLGRMIVDFRAAGLRELDLMRGAYAYKRDYAGKRACNLRFVLRGAV